MKIAVVAPVEETVPPTRYGGTELIVYHVAHGMARRGHQVDLFAAGDSRKDRQYRLVPIAPRSLRTDPRFHDQERRQSNKFIALAEAVRRINEGRYDLIHNHASWRFLVFSDLLKQKRILTTHHGPLSADYQADVFKRRRRLPHVSISQNQRRDLPTLRFVGTVYNGIDLELYDFAERAGRHEYLYFLARISPEKGAIEAADVARRIRRPVVLNGKVDAVDEAYFAALHPHLLGRYARFDGETGGTAKVRRLQRARALIAPIMWEEPFGLMFTEAMAAGTPVIAFARGSAPEIIEDGKTGFLVNQSPKLKRGNWVVRQTGTAGLAEAARRLFAMPDDEYRAMRRAARERVERHFTIERMLDGYERAYARAVR